MTPLVFNTQIAKGKPSNSDCCPFCDIENLTGIIEKQNQFIWLENKYQTLQDTYLTLIIESNEHLGDIASYSYEYNRSLIRYAVDKWLKLSASKQYRSVAMFKNFGPLSGGSLSHPHLQIVGFKKADIYSEVYPENFIGLSIKKDQNFEVNMSLQPIMGYTEFNVIISNMDKLDLFADNIKDLVSFCMSEAFYQGRCKSYNLFFYYIDEKIICKLVPRFVTPPYYVGYRQSQRNSEANLERIKADFLNYS
ncbi:DUF4931 domain-containing protein [Lactobacillus mulieris]|uniref:DUF4931 domain-containing protein n=1 Tax=Lactobacillus mulieris TaxID=2508708 RepID=A0AAW5WX05_9LACO|nr:DUF4931 domain-containing protein [Lactobacillus mulieris]MCZ3622164.1 DUF4931 domain-containing protein [Lactobacillus mulieris]MCZ3623861.1 DUF4931 domain-containing protein [Lactobacillus mulieris]MCZ3636171.1 DUF4931 domain-containing protein [Lactobacillus mulieris]MCZ3690160.1 DUF4931 domain-containing protein [Lactobacillus mulieris]MCZ3696241.1 DUF4931 domain-containing protein [Lactobacillus mulieris]